MAKTRLTFEERLALPDDSTLRNMLDVAAYHAFSPNGAWAAYVAECERYGAAMVEHGRRARPFLTIWAVNTHHFDTLTDGKRKKRREVDHAVGKIRDMARRAREMTVRDFPGTGDGT